MDGVEWLLCLFGVLGGFEEVVPLAVVFVLDVPLEVDLSVGVFCEVGGGDESVESVAESCGVDADDVGWGCAGFAVE